MSDMGNAGAERQSPRPDQPIVAFDFDGTLTIRDSFTEFLRWRVGPGGWALGLVKLAPALAAYARDRDRGRIKAASVREFLHGVDRHTLEVEAARFADQIWPRFMRPDALKVWDDWGRRGAHRVIVTASPRRHGRPLRETPGRRGPAGDRVRLRRRRPDHGRLRRPQLSRRGKGAAAEGGLWRHHDAGRRLWRHLGRRRNAGDGPGGRLPRLSREALTLSCRRRRRRTPSACRASSGPSPPP